MDDAKYCSVIQHVQASSSILLGPLTFVNTVHIHTLQKSKYDSYYRLWETAPKLECTQICATFKLSLCVSFLIIVIMLRDSRFIILISDPNLQGQLLLFKISKFH